jgi:hypothetical protein
LTGVDISIGIKQTLQQYRKSNSAAQDDKQHTMPHSYEEISKNTKEKSSFM